MKVLLAGDSFASDWQMKYPDQKGWPNLLAEKYDVTNVAQAGVGEYKILKQIQSVDLSKYDSIIISHTSPNRVHCVRHPIHTDSILHKDCDLMYSDLIAHPNNKDAKLAVDFFERYFEIDYYQDITDLICKEILNILGEYSHLNQLHLVNINKKQLYDFLPSYDINWIFTKYRGSEGDMNHLTTTGNQILLNQIEKIITEKQ